MPQGLLINFVSTFQKSAKAKKVVAEDSDENADLGSDDSNNSDDGSENEEDIEKYRALIFGLDKDKVSHNFENVIICNLYINESLFL